MNIAYYTTDYFPIVSGTTTRLSNTILELNRLGHQAIILTPQPNASSIFGETLHSGPSFKIPVGFDNISYGFSQINSGSFYSDHLNNFKADLVHIIINFTIDPGVLFLIKAAKKLKIPVVLSYHTHLESYFSYYKLWFKPLCKIILRCSLKLLCRKHNPILTTSEYMREYLNSYGIKDTKLWLPSIHNCFFDEKINDTKENSNLNKLLYVGRLEPEKNIKELLDLFSSLKKDKKYSLSICGSGSLKSLVTPVTGVNYLGEVSQDQLPNLYDKHDIFLTCSRTESFGLTTIEAMSRGLVVVAADCCGTTSIISHEKNGLLYTPGNISEVTELIYKLTDNSNYYAKLSANALTATRKYSVKKSVQDLLEHYKSQLN